mmetsp:Transcript_91816/g.230680  ORF Transcript_91816/g.230680 Transcript_91816/m.230680 type:complete len:352 (+) Transcript_91816:65-1120(+)
MAPGEREGALAKLAVALDPYTCIAKRTQKYASECVEAYLANQGAETFADCFREFQNLEVVWFSGNRLSRIEHLEENFRIREVYIQDNRLVSLTGIKSFTFLRVLLASNNQLRNLDKQLALLTRFAFLKKLDLFDNPVAEEPDYRLRIIYNVPQVELLDRHAVKVPERLKADEVVPNLDKVNMGKMEQCKRKPPWADHSKIEQSCFRLAKEIAARRRREEDSALNRSFITSNVLADFGAPPPQARTLCEARARWQREMACPATEDPDGSSAADDHAAAACKKGPAARTPRPKPRRPEAFAQTVARHLSKPGAKARCDLFAHSWPVSRREVDELTDKVAIKTALEDRMLALGG